MCACDCRHDSSCTRIKNSSLICEYNIHCNQHDLCNSIYSMLLQSMGLTSIHGSMPFAPATIPLMKYMLARPNIKHAHKHKPCTVAEINPINLVNLNNKNNN